MSDVTSGLTHEMELTCDTAWLVKNQRLDNQRPRVKQNITGLKKTYR